MKHETFLNILDFIAYLDIQIELLEHSFTHYNLDVPDYIKKYILTEILKDKNAVTHKKEVRKKVITYLKKQGCIINLPLK